MNLLKASRWILVALAVIVLAIPAFPQADRGKAEINAAGGKITIDYGRPQLKGRDPLTWQKDGTFWRMGMNATTKFSTPVDLMFDASKLPKGTYSLWLQKVTADQYKLVFNSDVPDMGMSHDAAKDVASATLKKENVPNSVEAFTLELKEAPNGGTFIMTWAGVRLSADFQLGK